MIRRMALGFAFLAALGALTGCGVAGTVDPVAAAATKSAQAGGVKAKFTITLTGPDMPQGSASMTGSGAFDGAEGEMTIDLTDLLERSGAPASMDGHVKEVMLQEDGHAIIYMQLPFLASMLPDGKSWMRLDLQTAGKTLGIDLNQLMSQAGNTSPSETLGMLKAGGDFAEVGTEEMDGVSTTHYKGTVDLEQASAAASVPAETLKKLRELGAPAQIPMEVWIGDDGLVRQIESSYAMTVDKSKTTIDLTMQMSDYGTAVSISAPPADQVFDATGAAIAGLGSPSKPAATTTTAATA